MLADDSEFSYLKSQVLKLLGIDLGLYKSEQTRRRLTTLLSRHGVKTFMEYGQLLGGSSEAQQILKDYFTVNLSEFFRDKAKFDELGSTILPGLRKETPFLHIWSAGCSCGAEPYSVAMLLESLGCHTYHILATDIDESILAQARAGSGYTPVQIKNVRQDMLQRYFTPVDVTSAVRDDIKRRISFRRHDLLADSVTGPFDLIICRNVLIYFTQEARDQVYARFHQALRPGGILFLGATEAFINARRLGFETALPSFYRKMAPSLVLARQ